MLIPCASHIPAPQHRLPLTPTSICERVSHLLFSRHLLLEFLHRDSLLRLLHLGRNVAAELDRVARDGFLAGGIYKTHDIAVFCTVLLFSSMHCPVIRH